ncbi:MAG: DUF4296 domain-containing protein [Ignavibacteriaceae bacterium]|nr:DUF4296 domain-containing protein [Ignavibacteriaceae bacterium]
MFRIIRNRLIRSLFFAVVILFLTGCDQKIDEEKFVAVYSDLLIAKDTISYSGYSEDDLLKQILKKHDVKFAEYEATISYYNEDSERWEGFFDKAAAYLEEQRKSPK